MKKEILLRCKIREGYPTDAARRIEFIEKIGHAEGWEFLEFQENIGMMYFHKSIDGFDCRINVYITKMSVTTYMNHPKKGKGQLYRKNVNLPELIKIFKNPRQHTGKGYYEN